MIANCFADVSLTSRKITYINLLHTWTMSLCFETINLLHKYIKTINKYIKDHKYINTSRHKYIKDHKFVTHLNHEFVLRDIEGRQRSIVESHEESAGGVVNNDCIDRLFSTLVFKARLAFSHIPNSEQAIIITRSKKILIDITETVDGRFVGLFVMSSNFERLHIKDSNSAVFTCANYKPG